jgi:hypothetical protein
MSDEPRNPSDHHHTLRERLDAAEAAADEVVADEGGQLAGEVSGLALPFEEAVAAVRAALHPHDIVDPGTAETAPAPDPKVTEGGTLSE